MANNIHANPVEIIKKEIYIIKNDINDKIYIGQSIDSEKRFKSHCKKSCGKKSDKRSIDYAIYQYGEEHFWYEILEEATPNYNKRERELIKQYNSLYPNGYNLMRGGEDPPIYRGEDNPVSKLTNIQIQEIADLLKNTKEPLQTIASKYNISKKQILRINQGTSRKIKGETYPLRSEPNMNGKLTEKDVDEIIHLLKYSYLFSGEIGAKFGVTEHAISGINKGLEHRRDNEKYPIREWKSCGERNFTYEQVTTIIDRLKNEKISINKMAKEYGVHPNSIYMINSGTSKKYRREGITYPIRPF